MRTESCLLCSKLPCILTESDLHPGAMLQKLVTTDDR
jgi:hypothetical protein